MRSQLQYIYIYLLTWQVHPNGTCQTQPFKAALYGQFPLGSTHLTFQINPTLHSLTTPGPPSIQMPILSCNVQSACAARLTQICICLGLEEVTSSRAAPLGAPGAVGHCDLLLG